MASVRCTAVQARPAACLALPSVTLDEFQQLVPPCAHDGTERRMSAPKTLRHRPRVRAPRTRTLPSPMSCASRPCAASSCAARRRQGVGRINAGPRPPRLPGPLGAGWCRRGAAWRSRSLRWLASGPRSHSAVRRARWHRPWPPRRGTAVGCGARLARGVSSVVAWSKTGAVGGRRGSGMS
jgi:hypothetical protein